MTGYLRSLAGSGVAPGPRIRPATVPFVLPELARQQEPAAWEGPPRRADDVEPAGSAVPDEEAAPLRPGRRDGPAVGPVTADGVEPPEPVPATTGPRPGEPESETSIPAARDGMDVADAIVRPAAAEPGIPRRPVPAARAPQAVASARAPRVRARAVPQRAAPPLPPDHGARPVEALAGGGEAPPDVHIHIGRIELTALAAPAPPRERPARPAPAMPLGEYLQRRGRKPR
jgi:hypothetical protein